MGAPDSWRMASKGSEASKALLVGGAKGMWARVPFSVPNLPCVTGTQLPLQQNANGKPLVRETAIARQFDPVPRNVCGGLIVASVRGEQKVRVFSSDP